MLYKVIDLETTIRNKIGSHKASSHNPENVIVLYGEKDYNKDSNILGCYFGKALAESGPPTSWFENTELLVGLNIKFDLLYLLRSDIFKREIWPKLLIWDCSIAEYLITGQEHLYPSLDECSVKYGGTLKDNKIKELWDSGVQTEDIDSDLLHEYLENDLKNTEIVFQQQFLYMKDNELLPLMWTQMGALKATIEMELNGMYIDSSSIKEIKEYTAKEVETLSCTLIDSLKKIQPILNVIPWDTNTAFNSPAFLAKILYGYEFEYKILKEEGTYKTGSKKGEPKFKAVIQTTKFKELVSDSYSHKTDEKTLERIMKEVKDPDTSKFIKTLLEYRGKKKELSTYIEGIEELIFPDKCIHGSLNHVSTATGRLSSTKPNLQNISN